MITARTTQTSRPFEGGETMVSSRLSWPLSALIIFVLSTACWLSLALFMVWL